MRISTTLLCVTTSLLMMHCAGKLPEPAIPDPETVFEGLDIGGSPPTVPLGTVEDRVEMVSPIPEVPNWRTPKRAASRPQLAQQPLTVEPVDFTPPTITLPPPEPPPKRQKAQRAESPEAVLKAALAESLVRPTRANHFGGSAITRYIYQPGKIYELISSPQSATFIMLPPGEHVLTPPVANSEEWTFGGGVGGEGPARQETFSVRPVKAGLTVRIALLTAQGRAYFVLMRSTETLSMPGITWELPTIEHLQAPPGDETPDESPTRKAPLSAPVPQPQVAVNRIHTAYEMKTVTGAPPWIPLTTWDDGSRTVIKFRQSLQYTVAPGVFAIGNNNKSSRVEVTPWEDGDPRHAAYYIVSGLYPILALKDGQGNEVRLTRVTGQAAPYKDITNAPR